jgi:predicted ferric reductase
MKAAADREILRDARVGTDPAGAPAPGEARGAPPPSGGRRRDPVVAGALWLGVYLGIVLAPVAVLVLAPTPPSGGFWWDVSMGLGFAGLTMMGVQFVLTARFKRATAPFGIDVIYAFHRYLAYALLAIVLLHPLILVARDPAHLPTIVTPWAAPPEVSAGTVSLLLLVVLVAASAFRKPLRIPYEPWRATHLFLSLGALAFAGLHLHGVSYYTGAPAVRGLWVLIGLSILAIVVWVRLVRPWRLRRRPFEVVEVRPELASSWTLVVEPVAHRGFPFEPGQFAWLTVDRSPFLMQEHPFSIASSPDPAGRMEFVIKELGDFTRTVGRIAPGTVAWVDGPYGSFSMDRHPEATGYAFLAGGIGIAPMMSMLRTLAERGDRRPHVVFAAHSAWDRVPLRDQLAALRERLNLRVIHVLEKPPEGWEGEEGWITRELLERHLPPQRAELHYFVCGPVPMIRAMEDFLGQLGIPAGQVHTELFDMV